MAKTVVVSTVHVTVGDVSLTPGEEVPKKLREELLAAGQAKEVDVDEEEDNGDE